MRSVFHDMAVEYQGENSVGRSANSRRSQYPLQGEGPRPVLQQIGAANCSKKAANWKSKHYFYSQTVCNVS